MVDYKSLLEFVTPQRDEAIEKNEQLEADNALLVLTLRDRDREIELLKESLSEYGKALDVFFWSTDFDPDSETVSVIASDGAVHIVVASTPDEYELLERVAQIRAKAQS